MAHESLGRNRIKKIASFILVKKIGHLLNFRKITKNFSGIISEMINDKILRTDGYCPIRQNRIESKKK